METTLFSAAEVTILFMVMKRWAWMRTGKTPFAAVQEMTHSTVGLMMTCSTAKRETTRLLVVKVMIFLMVDLAPIQLITVLSAWEWM